MKKYFSCFETRGAMLSGSHPSNQRIWKTFLTISCGGLSLNLAFGVMQKLETSTRRKERSRERSYPGLWPKLSSFTMILYNT